MKLFILSEKDCEYNDSTYDLRESATPIAAYRKRENAEAECDKRNAEKRKQDYQVEGVSNPEFFHVQEVEVADEDLVSYSAALATKKAAAEQAASLARAEITKAAMAAFEAHPTLLAFQWTQYTPHFNDGEACEFSVYDASVKLLNPPNKTDAEDGFADEYLIQEKYGYSPEHVAAKNAVGEVMKSIDEDDFEKVFGDHVEVTATRSGFEVEEYSHD